MTDENKLINLFNPGQKGGASGNKLTTAINNPPPPKPSLSFSRAERKHLNQVLNFALKDLDDDVAGTSAEELKEVAEQAYMLKRLQSRVSDNAPLTLPEVDCLGQLHFYYMDVFHESMPKDRLALATRLHDRITHEFHRLSEKDPAPEDPAVGQVAPPTPENDRS